MGISNNFKNQFGIPLWVPIVFVVIAIILILLWQYGVFGKDEETPKSTFDIPGLARAAVPVSYTHLTLPTKRIV